MQEDIDGSVNITINESSGGTAIEQARKLQDAHVEEIPMQVCGVINDIILQVVENGSNRTSEAEVFLSLYFL